METYNILNDINEYKNDICQILEDINKINDRLTDLNDLLNKYINTTCSSLSYTDSLIVKDQLSRKIDIEYILKKYNIFYSYYKNGDKTSDYINYVNFEFKDGIFINTFDTQYCVSKDELKRDKTSLYYIFNCINDIINTLK